MTDRFNFYDIYGYLIPGLTLVGLLWVPFGLGTRAWPDFEWSSAFVGLVAAYLLGLIVNRLTSRFVKVQVWDGQAFRYPSEILLDADSRRVHELLGVRMTDHLRIAVCEALYATFRIDTIAQPETRLDAFYLCRSLLQSEAISYAEQFEGLYTLCQILSVVLLLGGCYYFGWGISMWLTLSEGLILV